MSLPKAFQQYEDKAKLFVRDVKGWFVTNLKIVDRGNHLVPFKVNAQQTQTLFWVGMQLAAGVPVRIIILKARRMGISTVVTALGFYFACLRRNYKAFACAHDQDGTDTLWGISQTFYDELPDQLKHETKYSNRQELIYNPPHRSSYEFKTAGRKEKVGLARSKEITFLHISEKAFIGHFKAVAAGIKACVPKDNPLSCIFEESTANGEKDPGEFHESWDQAVKHRRESPNRLDGYIPLFFSWLDFPSYKQEVPGDYQWDELDEDELKLKDLGASEEQLYFRRTTISVDYNGDAATFSQEYPATPEEAFQATGAPAIPRKVIDYHQKLCKPPARRVVLSRQDKKVKAYDAPPDARNYWEVWYEPNNDCDYTVAGDVAEGKLSDPADEKSKRDFSAGAVLNRQRFCVDAIYHGRLPADEWGQQLRMCAEWYKEAWGTPEANAVGQAALVAFKDYKRTFQRRPSEPVGSEERELTEIGWKTTGGNRDFMIDMYLAACSGDEQVRMRAGFPDRLQVFSEKIVAEEKTFVRKKNGKREHQSGAFDDILFAIFIALQLHISCPRTLIVPDFTGKLPKPLDSRWVGGVAGPEDDEVKVSYDTLQTT